MEELKQVLAQYNIDADRATITPFGTGLINHTWRVETGDTTYILQRINEKIFTQPTAIDRNLRAIGAYLAEQAPDYLFVAPVRSESGEGIVEPSPNVYYRLFPFINGSHSLDVVSNAQQAFEAAAQFGRFTRLLSGFDADSLETTLPDFHNLSLRYRQFNEALAQGNPDRIAGSQEIIAFLQSHAGIVDTYEAILQNPSFRKRVTHHDTKISNVLFNDAGEALCVIDLDTVMPGYFISDVGDMMRTYLPTVSEEEADFSKIDIRTDVYQSIIIGYYAEMEDELTTEESRYFFYAGTFMIYMQALRFLTDYLNNDAYYGARYPGHNLVRAGNQCRLLQKLLEKRGQLLLR